jgi:hypothetical protein
MISEETRMKLRMAQLGKKPSEETRAKMSMARKGKSAIWNIGRKWPEERKKQFSSLIKTKIRTPEHNKKISEGQFGKKRGPYPHKGKKLPALQGENSPSWNGGDRRYWKRIVLTRDNFTCQECGYREDLIMEVHHILPVCLNKELREET